MTEGFIREYNNKRLLKLLASKQHKILYMYVVLPCTFIHVVMNGVTYFIFYLCVGTLDLYFAILY